MIRKLSTWGGALWLIYIISQWLSQAIGAQPSVLIFSLFIVFAFRVALWRHWLYSYEEGFDWHHLYTGLMLANIGWYWTPETFWLLLLAKLILIVGVWMAVDGLYQHWRQVVEPAYHSFWHYAGKPLYQLRHWLVRTYNWTWLNRL